MDHPLHIFLIYLFGGAIYARIKYTYQRYDFYWLECSMWKRFFFLLILMLVWPICLCVEVF